jgi:hypothetical protein
MHGTSAVWGETIHPQRGVHVGPVQGTSQRLQQLVCAAHKAPCAGGGPTPLTIPIPVAVQGLHAASTLPVLCAGFTPQPEQSVSSTPFREVGWKPFAEPQHERSHSAQSRTPHCPCARCARHVAPCVATLSHAPSVVYLLLCSLPPSPARSLSLSLSRAPADSTRAISATGEAGAEEAPHLKPPPPSPAPSWWTAA